jgi:hypothetical protein
MFMTGLSDQQLKEMIEKTRKQSRELEQLAKLYEKELNRRIYENYPKSYKTSERPNIQYEQTAKTI